MESPTRWVLLCHSGDADRLHQAARCAAAATSMGQPVDLVFFFDALNRLVAGELDAEAGAGEGMAPSDLFRAAADTGLLRQFACSASIEKGGHDPSIVSRHVDEILGWPTVVRLMQNAQHALYL